MGIHGKYDRPVYRLVSSPTCKFIPYLRPMAQLINFALPEFAFLDGNSHEGNTLEGRTVIQHIRSYTIMEALALDEVGQLALKDTTKTFEF